MSSLCPGRNLWAAFCLVQGFLFQRSLHWVIRQQGWESLHLRGTASCCREALATGSHDRGDRDSPRAQGGLSLAGRCSVPCAAPSESGWAEARWGPLKQMREAPTLLFLCRAPLQLIPAISSLSWFTTVLPLLLVLTVSAAKDATDDFVSFLFMQMV